MNIEHFLTIAAMVFASSGFWALISGVIERKRKKKTHLESAVLGLLHDRIYYLCKEYIREKKITHEEHDNLLHLYEPYKAMGGNGTAERLMKEIDNIPIMDD